MRGVRGIEDLGLFRVLGQPNLNFVVDRTESRPLPDQCRGRAGRDPDSRRRQPGQPGAPGRAAIRPGGALSAPYRSTKEAIEHIRLLSPSGERVSLGQLCEVKVADGASEIYREENRRYVAIKYSVRGRDLGSAVEEAIRKVGRQVTLPFGYHIDWAGEYESEKRAAARLARDRADHGAADLHHSVHDVQVLQMGGADSGHIWSWRR